jgi:hypothetical protein
MGPIDFGLASKKKRKRYAKLTDSFLEQIFLGILDVLEAGTS